MSEWGPFLVDGEPPETLEHLRNRGWMDLQRQPGFVQRARQVASAVDFLFGINDKLRPIKTVSELGCGDGSLLSQLRGDPKWGYDIGLADVNYARAQGLDVRRANILEVENLELGDIVVISEVLEHLAEPNAFLQRIPVGKLVVASSPSAETGEWHNEIHAWAWDLEGYARLFRRNGYRVGHHVECDGGTNTFGGKTGPQRFQALAAVRYE